MEFMRVFCRDCSPNGTAVVRETPSTDTAPSIPEHSAPAVNQLRAYEGIPLALLGLEAMSGLVCNVIVLMLYLRKRTLLHNAGNLFTVNLAAVDLLLSGVAIPVTIATQLLPSYTEKHLNNLCFADRSVLLFLAIGSAAGTALLALDRGDISLRASKRFFVKRRPQVAIWMMWLLCLATTVVPLMSMLKYDGLYGPSGAVQNISLSLLSEDSLRRIGDARNEVTCTAKCWKNLCKLSKLDLSLQLGFQVTIFVMAAILIITVYLRILRSVHQRNYRHAKKIGGQQFASKLNNDKKNNNFLLRSHICCKWGGKTDKDITMTEIKQTDINQKKSPSIIVQSVNYTKTPPKSLANSKQNSVEEASLASSHAQLLTPPKNGAVDRKMSECKTDFASVALSITVVLALKRMVAAKMKEKRKRMRHLRKMTILILLAFLLCWTPFHALPVAKFLLLPLGEQTDTCGQVKCNVNNTTLPFRFTIASKSKEDTLWNTAFLWSLALAAVTSTLNPFLYSFSREKIRKDLKALCSIKRDKNTIPVSSRGRLRVSAIWSSPWGRNKGNLPRGRVRSAGSPYGAPGKRHDKLFRMNTNDESSSGHETSDKLLTKSTLSVVEHV